MPIPSGTSRVQRQQLVDQVVTKLQEWISLERIAVGEKLPTEAELMAHFGVGRSTIREAVRILSHQGLITVRQGDGTYVQAQAAEASSLTQRLRQARAAEANEVRRVLELEMARLAALRRTEDDLARMRDHLARREQERERGNLQAFIDADVAFHTAIARATQNALLADLYHGFAITLRPTLPDVTLLAGSQSELHHELLDSIAQQQPERAAAATERLLGNIAGALPPVSSPGESS